MEKKLLHFDEAIYERTVATWNKINDDVNKMAELYEELKIGGFTQEVYKTLIGPGVEKIREKYKEKVAEETNKLRITGGQLMHDAMRSCDSILSKLSRYKDTLWECVSRVQSHVFSVDIDLQDCTIVKGRAVLTDKVKEAIKARYTYYIETENDQKTYDLLLKLKEAWDNVREHIKEHSPSGYNYDIYDGNGYGFTSEDAEGYLEINPVSVKWLQRQPAHAAND